MRREQWFALGMLVWISFSAGLACGQVDEELARRLRTEGVTGWENLEAAMRNVRCSYREEHNPGKSAQPASNCTVNYKDGMFLITRAATGQQVFAQNDRYAFEIGRVKETDQWDRKKDLATDGDANYGAVVRTPWCIFDVPMREVVQDPTFRITKMGTRTVEGRNLVDLEFTVDSTNQETKDLAILIGGSVVFDPERSWAIQEYDVGIRNRNTRQDIGHRAAAKARYQVAKAGPPCLKAVDYSLLRHGKAFASWKTDFLEFGPCNVQPAAFFLSAYGLSEPWETPPGRRVLIAVLSTVAVVVAGIAIALRARVRLRPR